METLSPDAIDILKRYSSRKLNMDQAMKALNLDYYGDLVVLLSKADLPFPIASKKRREKMVKNFVRIMKECNKIQSDGF